MKKSLLQLLLILGFSCVSNSIYSDCSPFSTQHDEDQFVQGPCYTFATVAALESVLNQEANLSEWYLYSKCVLGGYVSYGPDMVNNIVSHANSIGVLKDEDFYKPANSSGFTGCLNESDADNTPCIFICEDINGLDYDFCHDANPCPIGLEETVEDVGLCSYNGVNFAPIIPTSFFEFNVTVTNLEIGGMTSAQKKETINDELCQNQGVILFMNDYVPDGNSDSPTGHAVFVHGSNGDIYKYKDSWPGDPDANRTQVLDLDDATHAYIITGIGLETSCTPEEVCECELTGPNQISGATTFSLEGPCTGSKSWSISDNLSVSAGGGSKSTSITVVPNVDSCFIDTAYVSVDIPNCPTLELEVLLDPYPVQPDEILIFAQEICPGDIVELNIVDDNAAFPTTTYNWSVGGGSIVSGQGSPIIFVQVGNVQQGTLFVSVTAENDCGESEPISISIPFSRDCRNDGGDDGQLRGNPRGISNEEADIEVFPNPAYSIINLNSNYDKYLIIDMTNSIRLESTESTIDISRLANGIYFIKGISSKGKSKVIKFLKL